jgi:hypothetical protein
VGHLAEVMGSPMQPPGAQGAWACVPEGWRACALLPPVEGWFLAPAAQLVLQRGGPGGLYTVRGDGSLEELQEPPPAGLQWEPCCVVPCPLDPKAPALESLLFLVGPWPDVQVDPGVWGHGAASLPAFTVKAAAVRRVQLRAAQEGQGWYTLGAGWRPALWDPPPGAASSSVQRSGLDALEARWQHSYLQAGLARGRRRAADFEVQLLPCQNPGKRQRLGVHERLAARAVVPEAVLQARPLGGGPGPDDVTDAAAPTLPACEAEQAQRAAVRAAWQRLKTADLPREQYSTAFRLAHGALYVGGFLCHIGVVGPELACCSHPACASELESLSHAFLLCPAVAPAADWVCRVFGAAAGGQPPPASAQVLLGDSHAAWQPPAGSEHLWTALRVAFVQSVWQLRSRRSLTGRAFSATSVCGAVVAAVRASIQRDWARATQSLVTLSGACPEWFRGRSPALAMSAFHQRWAVRGVLCTVAGGAGEPALPPGARPDLAAPAQRPRLTLHFSLARPVPAPAAPAAGPPTVQGTQEPLDPG